MSSKTSPQLSKVSSEAAGEKNEDYSTKPEFIYGGPFIKVEQISPFMNSSTPINLQLQGTFKKSFAYYSLKERMPVILTKVIDYLSREGAKIKAANSASDDDVRSLIEYVTKLKYDLVTNKRYDPLTVATPEAARWNEWIANAENQYYFTNTWVFTECYIYRRLREGCELTKGLQSFDPFDDQKEKSFANSLEPMCVVAQRLTAMLPAADKDKRKADLTTLLKICLWANKCDLSLSGGEQVGMDDGKTDSVIDPFQMVLDFKDKLLVDDSGKICDQLVAKAEAMTKAIQGNTTFKYKCSCHRLATLAGLPIQQEKAVATGEASKEASKQTLKEAPAPPPAPATDDQEEIPKIPCPAKMTIPQAVMFDIVCDNAGYELFSDLCLAHYLIAQGVVQKVRFHVKKIPWFVSDVTLRDFKFVINSCAQASYSREAPAPREPPPAEGEAPPEPEPPRIINSNDLKALGEQWNRYFEDETFIVMQDDFWTSPHVFKDMKKYDPGLYRKLQFAVMVLFKGDLNYRKLLGERNCNSTLGFEAALQGFIPAPIVALRTVKADLICGLPKGKFEQLMKTDEQWMEKGDYGVIQFCAKAEPLKVSDRPCADYGHECFGVVCPEHVDL